MGEREGEDRGREARFFSLMLGEDEDDGSRDRDKELF